MFRIVQFGIYKLGYRALVSLLEEEMNVVGVVTKPDPGVDDEPLALLARSQGIPLLAPAAPGEPGFVKALRALRPDVIVVTGYHKILPAKVLSIPPRGVLNLHGSLLPRHRGPVPWKWAILNGEARAGMTMQVMDASLDRGPILSQASCPIEPEDTGDTLFGCLCLLAGPLLVKSLREYLEGTRLPQPQDEGMATYEGYPTEEDARISWQWDAERIRNLIRGFCPRPGAWTCCAGTKVRIRSAQPAQGSFSGSPGLILHQIEESLIVSTGNGSLQVKDLSVDGEDSVLKSSRFHLLGLSPGAFLGTPGLPVEVR